MRIWLSVSAVAACAFFTACSDNDASPSGSSSAGTGGKAQGAAGETLDLAGDGDRVMGGESGADSGGSAPSGDGGATPIENIGGAAGSAFVGGAAGTGTDAPPSVVKVTSDGDVSGIELSSLLLTPSFSTSIHDYYVRCSDGANQTTLSFTDAGGPHSTTLNLMPDQAVVVGEAYWVRCLPSDFPTVSLTRPGSPTPGYYLLNAARYAAVFNADGVPVWYARGAAPLNLESPAVNSLSFMRDASLGDAAYYEVRSLDTGSVVKIKAPDTATDDHELRLLPNGHALIFTDPLEPGVDLTGLKRYGADSTLLGCRIEELDASGAVVWSWSASDHIDPVQESLYQIDGLVDNVAVVDTFHCNAIDLDSSGNLLISMRNTNAAFYVERSTSKILWKLGGSAFNKDGAALIRVVQDSQDGFSLQHDARFQANGNITLFDDHGMGTGVSRGVEYAIDHDADTATPVFQFLGLGASEREGSFRRYADGDSVVSWGYVPNDLRVLTEIDATGSDVFDIAFSAGNVSYRAVKVPLSQLDLNLLRRDTGR